MKFQLDKFTRVAHLLDPASYAAAAETAATELDCKGYEEVLFVISCGVFQATGTVAFAFYEGATTGLGTGGTAIAAAAISAKAVAEDSLTYVGRMNLKNRMRYLTPSYDVDTDNCIFGITAILGAAKDLPVSQVNTVEFTI